MATHISPAPVFGIRYAETKDMDISQIAKLVRKDLRGEFGTPKNTGWKFSVRIERYSGGQSLDVTITACPVEFLNPTRIEAARRGDNCCQFDRHTDAGKLALGRAKAIVGQYNYDRSDSMTDYFDRRFYGSVRFGYDMEDAARETVAAGLDAARAIGRAFGQDI